MTKAATTRRARNLELGKIDASKRCALCKVAIPRDAGVSRFLTPTIRFCSLDCLELAEELDAMKAGR